ncbi:family 2A encapsulin nanocompartment cargo protein cysteine desulfurase [Thiolinea disciformis]|uniref:family 2A encapsulin nanocompartment cargo protein cysteine desulfurase n=1 Tax=Thiolinea disciformis TaxID=125614 RepID=UPI000367A969|nr:family 2A encapsulin nanocompartment cargo protein cysteine desulfurase [Thiolinea disciformis]
MTTQTPISDSFGTNWNEATLAELASTLYGTLQTDNALGQSLPTTLKQLPETQAHQVVNYPALAQRAPALVSSSLATGTVPYTYPDLTGLPRHGDLPSFHQTASTPQFYFLDSSFERVAPLALNIPTFPLGAEQWYQPQPLGLGGKRTGFDIHQIRQDFPILQEKVNGKPLIWFDNAATTQKPKVVIDRLTYFYEHENSNVHRAAHELAARASDAYDHARSIVAHFIGAKSSEEVIFVRGTTEGINLIAKSWGQQYLKAGDEIIISHLEHHANIVPWQQLRETLGIVLKVIPVDETGQILLNEYRKLLSPRTKLVSVTQVSNALGTVTPIAEIIALAKSVGAKTLIDGAQGISHLPVNVRALDTDFYVFSGHKIFGPTGIGTVYGKAEVLESLQPWQGGGNMIEDVTFEKTIFRKPPLRFEAGTANIADAVGLGAALEYVTHLGLPVIAAHEHALLEYATEGLRPIKGVKLIGTAAEKASVVSFILNGYSTEQVGKALNEQGIAVRTGHHCAQPILRRFGLETTVRPSLAFYNTFEEIDTFIDVVKHLSQRG